MLRPHTWLPMLGWSDKLLHFGGYFGLAFLPVLAFETRRVAVIASLSMILVGGAIELGQHFSPGRQPDILDMAANTAGVVCGLAAGLGVVNIYTRVWGRKESPVDINR